MDWGNLKHGMVNLIIVVINISVIHYVQLCDSANYYLSSAFNVICLSIRLDPEACTYHYLSRRTS